MSEVDMEQAKIKVIASYPLTDIKINLNALIWQPVGRPLSEGGGQTMQLAPLSWQASSAHYALQALINERDELRQALVQARDAALEEAAGWLECHTLHEPSPSYPANAGRYHAVFRKDDWGGLHIGQDYAAAIRALKSTTTKEDPRDE